MSNVELELPGQVRLLRYDDAEQLTRDLAGHIADSLRRALETRGNAAIALSGGRTPLPLFDRLSGTELQWDRIRVTLADDRWVAPEHADSNEGLIRTHLLRDAAANARFIGLWQSGKTAAAAAADCAARLAELPELLDIVVLGMGNDGHTASLFPCSAELQHALDTSEPCCAVTPTSAPHDRMTLSANRLLASRERILHLKGEDKLETLQKALAGDAVTEMPIRLFLRQPLTLYWSP